MYFRGVAIVSYLSLSSCSLNLSHSSVILSFSQSSRYCVGRYCVGRVYVPSSALFNSPFNVLFNSLFKSLVNALCATFLPLLALLLLLWYSIRLTGLPDERGAEYGDSS